MLHYLRFDSQWFTRAGYRQPLAMLTALKVDPQLTRLS